uniref:Uncharacterized protein n=1 Tax=Lactuca sativa TaxID=4236 RepID=A0A9R1UQ34_LACSA|nr:hypothetical protein LSAT_V11C800389160 [Lactuca sativa]
MYTHPNLEGFWGLKTPLKGVHGPRVFLGCKHIIFPLFDVLNTNLHLDTGFLIANKYGVIVYFLDKQGFSTCFPFLHGPQDISHHESIVIAFVYNGHYVKVDLRESHPLPIILSLWCHHCS